MTSAGELRFLRRMSNVLSEHTRQQVLALGRLGWSLRRIEEATGVRRETASGYLKTAGVPVRGRGGRPRDWPPKPATTPAVFTDPSPAKPATTAQVSTDLAALAPPGCAPRASTCEPYRGLPAAHRLALTEPSRRRTNAAPYTPATARPLIRTIRDSGWRGG